jgi:hypothetical protein
LSAEAGFLHCVICNVEELNRVKCGFQDVVPGTRSNALHGGPEVRLAVLAGENNHRNAGRRFLNSLHARHARKPLLEAKIEKDEIIEVRRFVQFREGLLNAGDRLV